MTGVGEHIRQYPEWDALIKKQRQEKEDRRETQ